MITIISMMPIGMFLKTMLPPAHIKGFPHKNSNEIFQGTDAATRIIFFFFHRTHYKLRQRKPQGERGL